jgi:hypothetical protein
MLGLRCRVRWEECYLTDQAGEGSVPVDWQGQGKKQEQEQEQEQKLVVVQVVVQVQVQVPGKAETGAVLEQVRARAQVARHHNFVA